MLLPPAFIDSSFYYLRVCYGESWPERQSSFFDRDPVPPYVPGGNLEKRPNWFCTLIRALRIVPTSLRRPWEPFLQKEPKTVVVEWFGSTIMRKAMINRMTSILPWNEWLKTKVQCAIMQLCLREELGVSFNHILVWDLLSSSLFEIGLGIWGSPTQWDQHFDGWYLTKRGRYYIVDCEFVSIQYCVSLSIGFSGRTVVRRATTGHKNQNIGSSVGRQTDLLCFTVYEGYSVLASTSIPLVLWRIYERSHRDKPWYTPSLIIGQSFLEIRWTRTLFCIGKLTVNSRMISLLSNLLTVSFNFSS